MIKRIILIMLPFALAACANVASKKDMKPPVKEVESNLLLIAPEKPSVRHVREPEHQPPNMEISENLLRVINASCYADVPDGEDDEKEASIKDGYTLVKAKSVRKSVVTAPLVAAIVGTSAKYVYDAYHEKLKRDVDDLKKSANRTYSANIIASSKSLNEANCIAFIRSGEDGKGEGLNVVLKLNSFEAGGYMGFTFTPIHLNAKNATVYTRDPEKTEDVNKLEMDVSIAMAISTLAKEMDNGVMVIPSGEGAVTVSAVEIGGKPSCLQGAVCPTSSIFPKQVVERPVAITVSVTEAGNVGIDFEAKKSEITALKDAMGPLIKDTIIGVAAED